MIPKKAFILAAGLGSRLRPHTDKIPKPMVEINGESLIKRIITQLKNAGVTDIYINTGYKADIIEDHLATIKQVTLHIYREEELRDTGGGIKQAIKDIGDEAFYVINGDSYTIDPKNSTILEDLAAQWDPNIMDILLALEPTARMTLTKAIGDYRIDDQNRCIRSLDKSGDLMFSSIRINHPRIFENTPNEAFSYLTLMDKAQEQGRLFGFINTGIWHHISTPKDLENVRQAVKNTPQ